MLVICPHLSTGGSGQVTANKIQLIKEDFEIKVIEHAFVAWNYVVQRNRIINLVGNALKFTEEGGVTVKVHLSDDFIRVVVADTGRGIPYENQMLLFHKFKQAGDSLFTRDTTKGTGLGLHISKLMVEGMGGSIGLQYSSPGKGSAFGFALPVVGSKHAITGGTHIVEQSVAQKAS